MFSTNRLQMESWSASLNDIQHRRLLVGELEAILSPKVLHHLSEPLQLSNGSEGIDDWISARDAESDVFTIRDLVSSDLVGLLILAEFPQDDAMKSVHLGYLLAEQAWSKGFATELIAGLVDWYRALGAPVQLVGGVGTTNIASAKVLEKNGFKQNAVLTDGETATYELTI